MVKRLPTVHEDLSSIPGEGGRSCKDNEVGTGFACWKYQQALRLGARGKQVAAGDALRGISRTGRPEVGNFKFNLSDMETDYRFFLFLYFFFFLFFPFSQPCKPPLPSLGSCSFPESPSSSSLEVLSKEVGGGCKGKKLKRLPWVEGTSSHLQFEKWRNYAPEMGGDFCKVWQVLSGPASISGTQVS